MKIKKYEDIFPLTIIQMRFGGKYVAFKCEIGEWMGEIQEMEEPSYNTKEYIEKKYSGAYGISDTIWGALDNLIVKHNE